MNKEPWLDGLTEDWAPDAQLSVSPGGTILTSLTGSGETIQAAAARRSIPRWTNNPHATKLPLSSRGSQRDTNNENSKNSPSPLSIPSGRESNASSNQFLQSQTIQVRNGNNRLPDDIPEWRKRILQGQVAPGESLDLFAPIGLERMFEPPKADEFAKIPRLSASRSNNSKRPEPPLTTNNDEQFYNFASNASSPTPSPPIREPSTTPYTCRHSEQDPGTLNSGKLEQLKENFSELSIDDNRLSVFDARFRTVSGREEMRNEKISPILPPTEHSDLEQGDSAAFSSIRIASDFYVRNLSTTSDGRDQTDIPDASLELTSQSLPEGLSMGTDMSSVKGYINMRRGGYSDDGSFFKRRLSPSSMPSQLPQSSFVSSQLWSSPQRSVKRNTVFHASQPPTSKPVVSLNLPISASRSQIDTSPGGARFGSPLKLFGNHDTFTNNRLLRRMGQFEENIDEDVNELPQTKSTSLSNISKRRALLKQDYYDNVDDIDVMEKGQQGGTAKSGQSNKSQPRTSDWLKRQKPDPADMKRSRNSPTKDPSSKRRRTLQGSNGSNRLFDEPIFNSSEFFSRNEIGDSKLDDSIDQGKSEKEHRPSKSSTREPDRPTSSGTKGPPAFHRPSSRGVQSGDVPDNKGDGSSPIRLGQVVDESRKGSITTQDFLDEATKIMNFIRANGQHNNGLSSLIESEEAECDDTQKDHYSDESSVEGFSRPPSREVRGVQAFRVPNVPNPRIVSHLKKFEENDELDMFMGASAMSLRLRRMPGSGLQSKTHSRNNSRDETAAGECSPKNIRIREAIDMLSRRNSSPDDSSSPFDDAAELETKFSTQGPIGSQNSSGSSGTKGIISSDMVSHLIPPKVGRMVYDHSKRTWVRVSRDEMPSQVSVDVSEDDPFRDIPDLSIDELQELITAREYAAGGAPEERPDTPNNTAVNNETNVPNQPNTASRPGTRDGGSSLNSKSTRFTGSGPKPDTRATSWATDIEATKPLGGEAEHEARLHDGYFSPVPSPVRTDKQPRVVTIGLPSPVLPQVGCSNDVHERIPQATSLNSPASRPHPLPKIPDETPAGSFSEEASETRKSFAGQLGGTEISRTEGNDEGFAGAVDNEMSMVHVPNHDGLSAISHRRVDHDSSYNFHLSPLPDFTVNQVDESMRLEVSYVAERTNPKSLRQVHGAFALAAETLVKHITDAEPFETYWEHLRQLDLRNKGLITLLKLNQFCPRLEELGVADNRIGQLSGVPSTIRSLNVSRNCLSNLTAWAHLSNLQYVDVSGNDLENLDGFSGLVHLRSLKANSNRIKSVTGVLRLDGLLDLELRDNELESVDFRGSEFFRLKHLDLRGNQLSSVKNIQCLPALESLDLRDNHLRAFRPRSALQHLRSLKLSKNRIERLDVSSFPTLQLLYVDCNCLSTVEGLYTSENLDTLSMREQTCVFDASKPLTVNLDISSASIALRKLYLSSNKLSFTVLSPASAVLNLQFLDLASCSLDHLPQNFGRNFPHLKALNLNFNALAEINPLEGVFRLSRLSLVGNRISRLRRSCQVLRSVGGRSGTLRKVDLRGNPITVGFYPAPVIGSGRKSLLGTEGKKSKDKIKSRPDALPPLKDCADIAVRAGAYTEVARRGNKHELKENIKIDDLYTIPPADPDADRKYLIRLDESTALKRRVVELMVHAATSGKLKALDGLALAESSSFCTDSGDDGRGKGRVRVKKDWVWRRLEELGVLKKKGVVGFDAGEESGEESEL